MLPVITLPLFDVIKAEDENVDINIGSQSHLHDGSSMEKWIGLHMNDLLPRY